MKKLKKPERQGSLILEKRENNPDWIDPNEFVWDLMGSKKIKYNGHMYMPKVLKI